MSLFLSGLPLWAAASLLVVLPTIAAMCGPILHVEAGEPTRVLRGVGAASHAKLRQLSGSPLQLLMDSAAVLPEYHSNEPRGGLEYDGWYRRSRSEFILPATIPCSFQILYVRPCYEHPRGVQLSPRGVYEPISGDDGSVNTGPLLSKKVRGGAIVGHGAAALMHRSLANRTKGQQWSVHLPAPVFFSHS